MSKKKNNTEQNETRYLDSVTNYVVAIGAISAFVAIALYAFNFHKYDISTNTSDWGTFGDFLGGVLNPILSFLSLILVLVTIKQQKISLEQSSEQMQLSFDEMTKSVIAQEKQVDIAEKQLKNVLGKNEVDDLVKVLREILDDIERSLSENLTCFSTPGKRRTLRSQILDVGNRKSKVDAMISFNKLHENKMKNIESSIIYYKDLLISLSSNENAKIMYDYYKSRIENLEISSGINSYKEG